MINLPRRSTFHENSVPGLHGHHACTWQVSVVLINHVHRIPKTEEIGAGLHLQAEAHGFPGSGGHGLSLETQGFGERPPEALRSVPGIS